MKAQLATNKGKKYLRITRSASTSLDDIKASRHEVQRLLHSEAIERVMSDCREVNFEGVSVIEADTLAKDMRDDIPACKWLAVICQSTSSDIFQHFKNVCSCYDIDVRFFTEPKTAEVWLCDEHNTDSP